MVLVQSLQLNDFRRVDMQHQAVVKLSWVPGTLNQVRLQDQSKSHVVALDRLEKVLGRPATFDLYTKGHMSLSLEVDTLASLTGIAAPLPA
jgi:hypothetical protein